MVQEFLNAGRYAISHITLPLTSERSATGPFFAFCSSPKMEQSQDKSLHASTFIVAWLQRPPPQSYSPPHQRTIINTLPTSASPRRPPPSYVNIPQKDANGTQHTHLGSNLSHEQRHRRSYATSPTSPCTTQSIIAGHDTRDDRKTRCHRPHPTGRARTSREPRSFPHRRGR